MEKAFEIQRLARDNVKSLQTYLTDLQNWESEMKRKEAALSGEFVQDLPPVRSKAKRDYTAQVKKKVEKRISSSDYKAWEKFDVDKACEEVDMEDVGPMSLDGAKSQSAKLEKLREEAQYEKERGNSFVKQEKWDEAIACYNRAIELVKDDAIYYANRGLCHLKKDSLHQAEADCTEALRLDPSYVKALQRRAAAREKLGSLRSASQDLQEIIRLEPNNTAARKQLEVIKSRMGTKGLKSKSSPTSTPTMESKPYTGAPKPDLKPKVIELNNDTPRTNVEKMEVEYEKWRNGDGEDVSVIKPFRKPPHMRSKRPLKSVPIKEIELGKSSPNKPSTRLNIVEIDDEKARGDTNNNDSNKVNEDVATVKGQGDNNPVTSPESSKLILDSITKKVHIEEMTPPMNSVQFMSTWKEYKDIEGARSDYLSIIEPSRIPSIFANALESDVLSELLTVLYECPAKFQQKGVAAYLQGISRVKRFSALAMFLTDTDKQMLNKLLEHCRTVEKCTENELADLKNKYEL